ncbi:YqhR family membrane protein [Shouchella lonarensis]|uniref:Conserved membrane protein YqhR n=1 Tax=Shouchella lonarensis TaxID=1464122 RepID=A0A1G6GMT4_9BACI|nr:YqhR family membrane protein [Shouchella lonarensis]SDB83264.1 Conserved membrane protein YqhR [Shouchella lonarensis]
MGKKKYTDHEMKQQKQMSFAAKTVWIGFIGGLLWSSLGYFSHYFNFMQIGPAFILQPWALGEWKNGHLGQVVGIFTISIGSIGVAFLYKWTLQKISRVWPGLLLGAFIWVLIFYLLNPFVPQWKPVQSYTLTTLITSLCLCLVYGLFIGYSIAYEYAEQKAGQKDFG